MKRQREIRPEWDKDEGSGMKRFLRLCFRHGEKVVAGFLIVAAVGFALQTRNFQPLTWSPQELMDIADKTEEIIENNNVSLEDNDISVRDFAAFAAQIRERVPVAPYRSNTEWHPVLRPAPLPRAGFEILSAKSFRGEAIRRTSLTALGKPAEQWQRPSALSEGEGDQATGQVTEQNFSPIWINLYGTLPIGEQWDIYNHVIKSVDTASRPEYVFYEFEKTELKPKEMPNWQPVTVFETDGAPEERLIPFGQKQETLQDQDLLLFSDFDVKPAATYAYRIRLYVRNPNYNLQDTSVEAGVDTRSEFVRSDWSSFAKVYVPDRTLVQLLSVTSSGQPDFPRPTRLLRPMLGTLVLDHFDIEQGMSLPLVEKGAVRRGMLANMSKNDANRFINRGNMGEVIVNYPDEGLRSNVCVMDFSGGRELQKRSSRTAQASPDLFVPGSALLLMPDGAMHVTSTEPELFQ